MNREINAITFFIAEMARSVKFYEAIGFEIAYGGNDSTFTSLKIGANFVNLQLSQETPETGWGRAIFHVPSPDDVHAQVISAGYAPEFAPADAPWGERYFHVRDPDGHELSFACRL